MRYDCLKEKMFDEALDQLEKEEANLPKTIYYPVWNGKKWVYEPIKNSKYFEKRRTDLLNLRKYVL